MSIDVTVETEDGQVLAELPDPDNSVIELLPDFSDTTTSCLRFIDPYGDTVFNQGQLPVFIAELNGVLKKTSNGAVTAHGQKLLALAEKFKGKVHTYLKFYGD
ncbi:hypothetical protein ACFL35_01675 [Candidatus Riflebacteria bacterium]